LAAVSGKTNYYLKLSNFDPKGSQFSAVFNNLKTAEEFASAYQQNTEKHGQSDEVDTGERTPTPKSSLKPVGFSRKKQGGSMEALKELISPPKKQRGKGYDDDIAMHHLGQLMIFITFSFFFPLPRFLYFFLVAPPVAPTSSLVIATEYFCHSLFFRIAY